MGGATLAGGRILDVAPPHRRRSDPALVRDLTDLLRGDPALDLTVRVRRAGLSGVSDADLCRQTGWSAQQLADAAGSARGEHAVGATRDRRRVADASLAVLETRLLDALDAQHGGLKGRLCEASGAVRRFVNLYVNEEDIRFLDNLDTALKDGDEVSVVPAIAGGSDATGTAPRAAGSNA